MKVMINLRHLEKKPLHLAGEVGANTLELDRIDEMIHAREPMRYDVDVERLGHDLLVHGKLHLALECECVRCLRPFRLELALEEWVCDIPLTGEERVLVENDCVDLTPFMREDILLAFPQHPLCGSECSGLPEASQERGGSGIGTKPEESSAWAELNKLKF